MAGDSLFLVFSNPAEGRENDFNKWYDNTHVPDVLRVPGVVAAQRYALAPMETPDVENAPTPEPPAHGYLAVYELDRDADEVMAEFVRRVTSGEMVLDDSLDLTSVSMSTWQPHGQRQKGDLR